MRRLAEIHWTDVERVGAALFRRFPERDPQVVGAGEVRELVRRLPRFRGADCPEDPRLLDAIRRAWREEYEEGD